jgi:serine/threonine protein kinase
VGDPAPPDGGDRTDKEPDATVDISSRNRRRPPATLLAEAELQPGDRVARYLVVNRIGEGGGGLVYAVYDPELDRKVALKLLRTATDAEAATEASQQRSTAQARLLREAQAMARLNDPNIVPVYDVGVVQRPDPSGRAVEHVYVIMELVEGGDLRAWLRRPHERKEILEVLCGAGEGLAAAHEAGLIHRDFKPDNVLVSDGPPRKVRVTDFGLVRAVDAPEWRSGDESGSGRLSASSQLLTRDGTVMGTPAYMAPEQHEARPTHAATDQYAFCVTLYEALYGERPFAGPSMEELGDAKIAGRVREAPAQTNKARAVPPWLRRVLLRGLSADPLQRYPSMRDLLAALRDDPAVRRRRALWATAALLALATLALGMQRFVAQSRALCKGAERKLAGVWDGPTSTRLAQAFAAAGASPTLVQTLRDTLDRYAQAWVAMHTEACEATRVRGEQSDGTLALRMSCLESRRHELGTLTHLLSGDEKPPDHELTQKALEAVGGLSPLAPCADVASLTTATPPPADPQTRARVERLRVRVAEARALKNAARFKEGLALVDELTAEAEKLKYPPLSAEALIERGEMLIKSGRHQDAESALVEAYAQAYEGRAHESSAASALSLINDVGYWLQHYPDAWRWVRLARAALTLLPGREDLEAKLMREQAQIHVQKGEGAEAVAQAQKALAHAIHAFGERDHRVAAYYTTLGLALRANDDLEGAWKADQQDLAISRATLGEEHPDVAIALINLGVVAADQHKLDLSEEYESKALGILERTLGPDHPTVGIELSNFGETLRDRNRCEQAMSYFRRSLAINERAFGPDHPDGVYPLYGLADCLLLLKRPAEAVAPLERALSVLDKGEPDPLVLGNVRFALAQALFRASGDRARSLALAQKARDVLLGKHDDVAKKVSEWLRQPR